MPKSRMASVFVKTTGRDPLATSTKDVQKAKLSSTEFVLINVATTDKSLLLRRMLSASAKLHGMDDSVID